MMEARMQVWKVHMLKWASQKDSQWILWMVETRVLLDYSAGKGLGHPEAR